MRKPENTLIKSASDKASPGVDVERDGPHIYATIGMRAAYQYPSLPQVACPSIEQGNIHQTRYVLFELGNAVQEPAAPSAVPVPDDLSKVEQAPQNLVAAPNSPDIAGNALVVAPTNRVDVAADPQWGLLAYALYDAISLDLMLCPGDRWKVYRLYRAGYRAGNVVYFMEETWPKDWRAAKNEPLTFEILLEHIADSRSLHPGGAGDAHELMRRLNIVRERLANGLSVTEDDLLPDPKICANLQ